MEAKSTKQMITVSVLGALAVALGALGAHFLKSKLPGGGITVDQLSGFDTAVKYQMYHTLAMMLLIILNKQSQNKYFDRAFTFFFWGIVLFSGSLYFLCTRNLFGADWLKVLGPITPLGGVFFIVGWLCLIPAVLKKEKNG